MPGGRAAIALNTGIGEQEGAWIVVAGAGTVAQSINVGNLGPITVAVDFGHFVSFDGKPVADALLPWDGKPRPTEKSNQPLFVRVTVPAHARAGAYAASITVYADGRPTVVPLTVKVSPVRIPPAGTAPGNLLTSFHISPQTYVNKASELYGFANNEQRSAANRALFGWLADYRISPASWGFGEPTSERGYEGSGRWWLDSAGNMAGQVERGTVRGHADSDLEQPPGSPHRRNVAGSPRNVVCVPRQRSRVLEDPRVARPDRLLRLWARRTRTSQARSSSPGRRRQRTLASQAPDS